MGLACVHLASCTARSLLLAASASSFCASFIYLQSVTCSKLRIFGVSKGFEQAVDGLWMMSLLLRLAELLREVHRPVEKRSTLSKRKRDVAYLRLAKVVVDLGQAVPDALGVDTPPVVDPLLGFTSSILGAAILWVHSSRAEDDDL